ncbi:CHAT domain-containing protein [Amycolatopsis sp. DG1A-15b]|uniref:CHAT domain-containing protein n=1 Tax=Amycolatopsis sp. DG1A-15b TaxID=3052846 RepID=UPI00255C0CAB|nr:CHAT domain-containing protein [Amycolatopsis sp. DG1A-15b]WIX88132.1 CHAT domain-containing protein [Amycolatopsis sp. DG1A-15b]
MTGALAKAVAAADLAFTAPVRARALAGAALAEADGHAETAAVAEHALGLAGVATGRLTDAETRLRAAVRLADGAGLRERAAQTRGVLGYVLTLTGRTAEALRELDRAMPELTGTAAARLRMQRAVVLTEISRFGAAAAEFAAALETLRAAGGDALIEATVRTNRSIVLARLGDWRGAEEDLRRAEHGFTATGHLGRTAMVWQNRGLAATVRGDVPAALAAYDEAASRYEEAGTDQGLLPIERAETLLSVRLIAEAREAATAAVADYRRRRNAVDLVQARLLLAKVALLDDDPETALREATLARRSAARQHRPGWAALGGYLALRARRDSGHRTTAMLRSGQRTVAALADAGWVVPALDARLIVASLALALGRPAVAEAELTVVGRAGRDGPAELRARAWHATALLRLVRGDRRGADAAVRAGVRVIGRFRAGLGASELRAHASGHASELTGLGLRLAVEAGHPEAVLRWAEQRHAGALRLRPAWPPDDEGLAADLAALRQTAVDLAAGTGQAPALLRRQARLEKAVRDRARHASGASTSDSRIPSRAELAAALGPATLVEYVELDGRLTALVLGGGRLRRCELGSAAEAAERLDELRFALRRRAFGLGSFAGLAERTARRLDDLLLAPLPLGDGPLVIVPTGRLHELPWPALPGSRGRPVSLAPSAALWHRAATAPRGEGGDHVLVAGPGLPHAAAEAAALARRYPGARRFTGRTARVEPVLAALDGAALGHLAAHGVFRTDNPLFSSLRLADGPLTVYDLERLARPPRQVVLSGCDSGRSAIHAGDELLGLASALLALGTTSLVATVLPIPDDAGRALMLRYHRHLAAGHTPAAALAQAQSELPDSPAAASYVCYGAG